MNSSIGQGEVRLSPIAEAKLASTFANRGKVLPQKIVKDFGSYKEEKNLNINKKYFEDIEKGLKCAADLNSASLGIKTSEYPNIAVKTGSAETGQVFKGQEVVHGWEISYGPIEKPQIAMSIFLENGTHGSRGGYISREFYKYYTEQNP
jgi:penicillin-binding protein 2